MRPGVSGESVAAPRFAKALAAGMLLVLLSGCGGPAAGAGGTDPAAGLGAASAGGSGAASGRPGTPTFAPVTPATPAPAPTAVTDVPRQSAELSSQPGPVSAPVRVEVAALGIDMSIEAVGTAEGGAMALPANPAVAAWYRYGSGPGSAAGATVVAAHVDSLVYDIGPFAELPTLRRHRDRAAHRRWGGTSVLRRIRREHSEARRAVGQCVRPHRAPRLTLVTCGGEFDYEARRYLSNVIVTAVPVP